MASTNETGHAVNVANLESLISTCAGFDGKYNPSNSNLAVTNLQTFYTNAAAAIKDVQIKKTAFDNAVIERAIVFEPIKKTATRVINALISSGAKKLTADNARSINLKIQGKRAKAIKTVVPDAANAAAPVEQPKTVSTSQQSFDQVVNNFSQLIEIIKAEPLYKPNESDLSVVSIEAQYTTLKAKNSAVIVAENELNKSRISRNKIMYSGENNITEKAKEVKSYVKSIFGASSAEFKLVNGFKFNTLL
jgi:hypothetical protein